MSDFKAKNAPNSISAGALPQTPLGELTARLQAPWLDLRGLLRREGREGEGKGEGVRGKGTEEKGEEGREEGRGGKRGGEGGEGRGEEAFLVMWPRRLSALNPPLVTV